MWSRHTWSHALIRSLLTIVLQSVLGESLIETDYEESTLMAICSADGSQTSYFKPAQLIYWAEHIITKDGSLWCGVHSFGPSVCVHMRLGWACRAKPKMDALKDSILIFKVIPKCYFLRFFLMEENWVGIKKRISCHVFLVGSFECSSAWRWIQPIWIVF